ncbi:1986_t:CDS:2 [Dentiscutata heterogama]|uniref:1986_t:CDS:1 n=1 Tax=Dentiscutata heterogama TaxID=1316150 RepID=A0ACA9K5N9_9GLOM|nr:1986_t:CDS:2 [Dentiscutata heterogama]
MEEKNYVITCRVNGAALAALEIKLYRLLNHMTDHVIKYDNLTVNNF